MFEPGSSEHLSQVISHVIAPSFLLGAVASFISLLFTRLTTILDRLRALNALPDDGHPLSKIKADLPASSAGQTWSTLRSIFLS